MDKIAVLGAGTWGTVIANLLSDNGYEVKVYARNMKKASEMTSSHIHPNLPKVNINKNIIFTSDIKMVLDLASVFIYAIPSNCFRSVVSETIKYANDKTIIISLTKGVETNTLFTMTEIIEDELKKHSIINDNVVALSGPTHAEEVGLRYPSTIISASKNESAAKYVQDLFMNEYFRVYTNDDIKGVEICAAFKNVIALASGMLTGLSFGDNIKAALLTRGLAEMMKLGKEMGCKINTFFGLAGIGDMIVTAYSEHSRNYRCGKLIGEGMKVADAVNKIGMVVESINFIPQAMALKKKYNVELPITSGVAEIVLNNREPKEILTLLMTRSKKPE